ncbi:MAG TPA: hypothetical protein CFH78_04855 [Sulfurimonas sp. UBA10385]|nr:MAG TPA: hypothetical protein CFH78_04855 [Sulfurimonas sp. UBA10385]
MIFSFTHNFKLIAALKDQTARHVQELKTDDEKMLRVISSTGEALYLNEIECFIVNGTPRTKR